MPDGCDVGVGQRVRVVFAGRRRTGWVVGVGDEPRTDPSRIRSLSLVQGEQTWFDPADVAWYRWIADRYAAELADVLRHALPDRVAAVEREAAAWPPAPAAAEVTAAVGPPDDAGWRRYPTAPVLLRAAEQRGAPGAFWLRALPDGDAGRLVTDLVVRCLRAGRSALVLAPDPGSPAPGAALAVARGLAVDLRGDDPRSRYRAFLRCRIGGARVAVGERSAVFAPLRDLGLVVVADEANPAYKERRSPRHHAREVALARARMAGAACVLLGDLPSAPLWRLLGAGHVTRIAPDRRSEGAGAPRVDVVDLADPRPAHGARAGRPRRRGGHGHGAAWRRGRRPRVARRSGRRPDLPRLRTAVELPALRRVTGGRPRRQRLALPGGGLGRRAVFVPGVQ